MEGCARMESITYTDSDVFDLATDDSVTRTAAQPIGRYSVAVAVITKVLSTGMRTPLSE